MKVFHGRSEGAPSEQRGPTFTGTVWADPIMPMTDQVHKPVHQQRAVQQHALSIPCPY